MYLKIRLFQPELCSVFEQLGFSAVFRSDFKGEPFKLFN